METAHVSDPASAVTGGSYSAPYCAASGACSGVLFRPEDFSLWRVEGELGEGAALEWGTAHGDEALYVIAGGLDCEGRRVGQGSALIVEAGVPALVRPAGRGRVVHFGTVATESPTDGILGPPALDGRRVHIVPPERASSVHFGGGDVQRRSTFRMARVRRVASPSSFTMARSLRTAIPAPRTSTPKTRSFTSSRGSSTSAH